MPYLVRRFASYFLGLFILSLGVSMAVQSNLGATANSAVTYALSFVTGLTMGTCVMIVYAVYVLLQFVLLGRAFKPVQLLQLPISVVFGLFVDLTGLLVSGIQPGGYPGKLAMLAVSLICMAVGVFFYLPANLVLLPVEGLTSAVMIRLKKYPFHIMKIAFDSASVVAGAAICLVGAHTISGIREGTILIAIFSGKLLGVVNKYFENRLLAFLYGPPGDGGDKGDMTEDEKETAQTA